MKRYLVAALLVMSCVSAHAELDPATEAEVVREVWKLSDMLRRNVEAVTIELDGIKAVELTRTTLDGTVFHSTGALVPFIHEGVENGNLIQEYIVLFSLIPDKESVLWEDRQSQILNQKQTQLLGFARIDRHTWGMVDWNSATISNGGLTATAHELDCVKYRCCGNEQGSITVQFNGDLFGPNLTVTNHPNPSFSRERCAGPWTDPPPALPERPK